MNKHFIHFLSNDPCMLTINGTPAGQIDHFSKFELDVLLNTNKVYVTYEPVSKDLPAIPYSFLIDTNCKNLCDNKYIKVVPFPNNHYDIIMNPFYYYQISESIVLYNGQVGKYFISITTDTETTITIYSGASIVFSHRIEKISAAKVSERHELLIITGVIDDKTYRLMIIDTQNFSIIHNDISHSIEENIEEITTIKKLNTLLNHLVVCKVKFMSKTSENFHVIDDSLNSTIDSNILLPMAFLQSIQIGDISSATNYLSNQLQKANIDQIKSYLGNFDEIYLNRHNVLPNKINYTLLGKEIHNFSFLIDDNKITEIIEEDIE